MKKEWLNAILFIFICLFLFPLKKNPYPRQDMTRVGQRSKFSLISEVTSGYQVSTESRKNMNTKSEAV